VFDYFIHSLYTVINTQRGCHTLKLSYPVPYVIPTNLFLYYMTTFSIISFLPIFFPMHENFCFVIGIIFYNSEILLTRLLY